MCSAENLRYIGMPEIGGIDSDEIAKRLVDFLLGILHYRLQSQVLCRSSLPEKTILGLSADAEEAVATWKAIEDDAETLAWIETMAHFSESMASISARIPWKNALPRLVLRLAELEKFPPRSPMVMQLLQDIHSADPDTKVCEDLHQHIRDKGRYGRNRSICRSARMEACIKAGVLEQRRMDTVAVTSVEVRDAPYGLQRRNASHLWKCLPKTVAPKTWSNIMLPTKDWPSP